MAPQVDRFVGTHEIGHTRPDLPSCPLCRIRIGFREKGPQARDVAQCPRRPCETRQGSGMWLRWFHVLACLQASEPRVRLLPGYMEAVLLIRSQRGERVFMETLPPLLAIDILLYCLDQQSGRRTLADL